jgi:CheY-like chemotaxis protein
MSRYNILIIDDEPDVVTYLSEVLDSDDYELYTTDNAVNGFELAEKIGPDLICLDIMMPAESGLTLYTKIRRTSGLKNIPVIIVSGMEQKQDFDFRKYVDDDKIPPPDYYFEKPIDIGQFIGEVERLLSARKKGEKEGRVS